MSCAIVALEGDTNSLKILVANTFLSKPLPLKVLQSDTLKKKELLIKNPTAKYPFVETDHGTIFQTNTILRFLSCSNHTLGGGDEQSVGLVNQWLDFTAIQI